MSILIQGNVEILQFGNRRSDEDVILIEINIKAYNGSSFLMSSRIVMETDDLGWKSIKNFQPGEIIEFCDIMDDVITIERLSHDPNKVKISNLNSVYICEFKELMAVVNSPPTAKYCGK